MKTLLAAMLTFASPIVFAANGAASVGGLLNFVVYIMVVGLIFWLLWWLIAYVGLPEPFAKVAKIVLAVFAVLICINILLGMIGTPIIRW